LYLPGIIAIKVDFFQYAIIQVFILISSILRYKLLVQLLFLMILIILYSFLIIQSKHLFLKLQALIL